MKLPGLVAILLLLAGSAAQAGRVVHESLPGVVARSPLIVAVEILAAEEYDVDRGTRAIAVTARPLDLLRGELPDDADLDCEYTEPRVQRRGDAVVSPLVSGSGLEFQLRRRDRAILLLAAPDAPAARPGLQQPQRSDLEATQDGADEAADDAAQAADAPPPCRILRAEPTQNRGDIRAWVRRLGEQ
jgi:hypothetical protein